MSFDERETSQYGGQPYELFLFQTETESWCLTTADEIKTYLGTAYTPEALTRTSTSQGSELQSGTVKVTISVNHPVARLFVPFIPATPLFLTIFRAHDGEPDSETIVAFAGKVISATFTEFCELACAPEQQTLKRHASARPLSETVQPDSLRPRLRRGARRVQSDGRALFGGGGSDPRPEFAAKPDGWFAAGYVELGVERRMILDHTGDTLTLRTAMASLHVGVSLAAYAGCMRDSGTCNAKFNNGARFFGFEWIPTRNPFDGIG